MAPKRPPRGPQEEPQKGLKQNSAKSQKDCSQNQNPFYPNVRQVLISRENLLFFFFQFRVNVSMYRKHAFFVLLIFLGGPTALTVIHPWWSLLVFFSLDVILVADAFTAIANTYRPIPVPPNHLPRLARILATVHDRQHWNLEIEESGIFKKKSELLVLQTHPWCHEEFVFLSPFSFFSFISVNRFWHIKCRTAECRLLARLQH